MWENPLRLDDDLESVRASLIEHETKKLFQIQDHRNRLKGVQSFADNPKYSLTRALNALYVDRPSEAMYEQACSDRIAEIVRRQPHPGHFFVPVSRRDLTAGIASAGGYLTDTETAPGDLFVGFLNASSVVIRHGISRIGLVGNASIPRISGQISTYWMANETTPITESQFTLAISAATPKTVGAYCEISNLLLKQTSPAAQTFVFREMARAVATELDKKILAGSGASGQPLGILTTSGIGSVSGTSLAYAGILDLIKAIEDKSGIVDPTRAGFVIAPDAARLLRAREKAAGSGTIMIANDIGGYPAQVTKSIPDASLVLGDWSQSVLLEWSILEVGVDPYGADGGLFERGAIGIRSLWTTDLVLLHVESFGKVESIT